MADYEEKNYAGDVVRTEQPNYMSRGRGTVKSGEGALKAGTVLAKILVGAASAAAFAGNTGTGAMGAITVSLGAKAGVYKLVIIEPGANAGKFTVEDPDGISLGVGTVAVAFSAGGLAFTLADATDFIAGDGFDITVAAGSGKYVQPISPAPADGSGVGTAVLLEDIDATSGDVEDVALLLRDAQVAELMLIYDASIDDAPKKAIVDAGLLAANIQFLGTA
ncbi:MAG: head decoration protein [Alphaproteobacteria bacterium]